MVVAVGVDLERAASSQNKGSESALIHVTPLTCPVCHFRIAIIDAISTLFAPEEKAFVLWSRAQLTE